MPMMTIRYVSPVPRPELRPQIATLASRLGQKPLASNRP